MCAVKNQWVDHKNRNPLDNRRENLRFCTISQNNSNKQSEKNSTSKYLGVSLACIKRTTSNKTYINYYWAASIGVNGVAKQLGKFKTELEAAIIYNIAARKYHREFANPNKFKSLSSLQTLAGT